MHLPKSQKLIAFSGELLVKKNGIPSYERVWKISITAIDKKPEPSINNLEFFSIFFRLNANKKMLREVLIVRISKIVCIIRYDSLFILIIGVKNKDKTKKTVANIEKIPILVPKNKQILFLERDSSVKLSKKFLISRY